MRKEDIPIESYGQVDQIITTTNKSVNYLNNLVRQEVYGLESQYPYVGEKLMILNIMRGKLLTCSRSCSR